MMMHRRLAVARWRRSIALVRLWRRICVRLGRIRVRLRRLRRIPVRLLLRRIPMRLLLWRIPMRLLRRISVRWLTLSRLLLRRTCLCRLLLRHCGLPGPSRISWPWLLRLGWHRGAPRIARIVAHGLIIDEIRRPCEIVEAVIG